MIRQKRIPGIRRDRISAALLRQINDRVTYAAVMNDVSKSFVVAYALAEFFGIQDKVNYDTRRETHAAQARILKQAKSHSTSRGNVGVEISRTKSQKTLDSRPS